MWLAPTILSATPEGGWGGEGASQGRIISWHVADVTEHESQLAALQACLM